MSPWEIQRAVHKLEDRAIVLAAGGALEEALEVHSAAQGLAEAHGLGRAIRTAAPTAAWGLGEPAAEGTTLQGRWGEGHPA